MFYGVNCGVAQSLLIGMDNNSETNNRLSLKLQSCLSIVYLCVPSDEDKLLRPKLSADSQRLLL